MDNAPPAHADPGRSSLLRNPFLWAALVGLVLIPLVRPLFRFEPDPPPVRGQVPSFTLIDGGGSPFGSRELAGQVYVTGFFFTRCTSICPLLIASMAHLDRRYGEAGVEGVRLVGITVDPSYDTPERLGQYARNHGIDPQRWSLLTGDEQAVHDLVVRGFKAAKGEPVLDGAGVMDIAHAARLVLVDGQGGIRGYYETSPLGLDEIYHRFLHVLEEQNRRR